MSEACSQYQGGRCKSGFPRLHPVCWGGNPGCPHCGKVSTAPMCMQEEIPKHLTRDDGLPTGWPASMGRAADQGGPRDA